MRFSLRPPGPEAPLRLLASLRPAMVEMETVNFSLQHSSLEVY